MSALVFYLAIICLLPVATVLLYPIYKLFGGELTLGEMWRGL